MLFVHIPKTAGTSFRTSLAKFYGEEYIAKDYGPYFSATSDVVRNEIHKKNDLYSLRYTLKKKGYKVLGGHFPASRYTSIFPVSDCVAFLRDPVQRFYSEYQHRSNRSFDRFEGSIEEYCEVNKFCNVQSRMLAKTAWPAFACVALTESYTKSLEFINADFGVCLNEVEVNKRRGDIKKPYDLTEKQIALIIEKNSDDCMIYEEAKKYFEERIKLENPNDFVRGRIEEIKGNRVYGYAIPNNNTEVEPVEVQLLVNDIVQDTTIAKDYRKNLDLLRVKRKGHVGFSFDISKFVKGDVFQVSVKDTGQKLAYKVKK